MDWAGAFVTGCRWLTLVALAAMFVVIVVRRARRTLRWPLEANFSVAARCIVGLGLMLGAGRALTRPTAIVPGDNDGMTVLIVAIIALGSVWMVLASLPLQQLMETRAKR